MRQDVILAAVVGLSLCAQGAGAQEKTPTYADVKKIISIRCQICHSEYPSQIEYSETGAPNGVKFDTADEIKAFSPLILQRAVIDKIMPPGNLTGVTEAERETIGAWIRAGAQIP